jgi:uncharacterized protein (DUF433 family)
VGQVAYPIPLTVKLSGATTSQLAHWRRKKLLVPEVNSTGRPLLYSFRDITALRTFAKLRHDVSLQKIRKAMGTLHQLDDMFEHPSEYRLVSQKDTIVLYRAGERSIDLVKNPGQLLIANFEDVLSEFVDRNGNTVVDLRQPAEHITIEPERLGGWPTIEGTRVPYDTIADLLLDGSMVPEDVNYFYPSVSTEAAESARDFARSIEELSAA